MQRKLSEIVDLPSESRVVVYGRGSLVGEEEFMSQWAPTREEPRETLETGEEVGEPQVFWRSATLKCISERGKVFRMTKD